jgi:hypothetical protein
MKVSMRIESPRTTNVSSSGALVPGSNVNVPATSPSMMTEKRSPFDGHPASTSLPTTITVAMKEPGMYDSTQPTVAFVNGGAPRENVT